MSLFPPIKSSYVLPLVAGRVVVVAPSMRHVKALQNLLKDQIDQRPAVKLMELTPETDDKLLVFAESTTPFKPWVLPTDACSKRLQFLAKEVILELGQLTGRDTFLTAETFVVDDTRCIAMRDRTSRDWAGTDPKATSEMVFAHYPIEFEKLD